MVVVRRPACQGPRSMRCERVGALLSLGQADVEICITSTLGRWSVQMSWWWCAGERIQKLASKGRFNGAHFSRDANAGSFDEAACKYAENAPNFLDAEKMLM